MAAVIVRIDCSSCSYFATCALCPTFRGAAHIDVMDARRDADQHRRWVHPTMARDTVKKRRRRAGGRR